MTFNAQEELILDADRAKVNETGDPLSPREEKAFRAGMARGYVIAQREHLPILKPGEIRCPQCRQPVSRYRASAPWCSETCHIASIDEELDA